MAKRTVTRWVSQQGRRNLLNNGAAGMCVPQDGAEYCVPIEVTLDDGEPEGKCPCDNPEIPCCRKKDNPNAGNRFDCCSCHDAVGKLSCLSDWHKKAETCRHLNGTFRYGRMFCGACLEDVTPTKPEPATRDRVVEGFAKTWPDTSISFTLPQHTRYSDAVPATLIIHQVPCGACDGTGMVKK